MTLAAKLRTCHSSLELQCHLGLGVTFQRHLGWCFAHLQPLNPYFIFPYTKCIGCEHLHARNSSMLVHACLLFEITLENHCPFQRVAHTCNPSPRDSIGACWDGGSCCVQTSLLLREKLGQQSFLPDLGNQQSSHTHRAAPEAQSPRLEAAVPRGSRSEAP